MYINIDTGCRVTLEASMEKSLIPCNDYSMDSLCKWMPTADCQSVIQ